MSDLKLFRIGPAGVSELPGGAVALEKLKARARGAAAVPQRLAPLPLPA